VRVISPKEEVDAGQAVLHTLLDCHRKHDQFVQAIRLLLERPHTGQLHAHESSALVMALHFFQDNRPLHHADEEQSIFPRLRGTSIEPKLKQLCLEHKRLTALHRNLETQLGDWLRGSSGAPDRQRLQATLNELQQLFLAHRALEEKVIYPFARNSFSPADWAAIAQELEARRK
jgi:hemerythrin-like domain-containing protein